MIFIRSKRVLILTANILLLWFILNYPNIDGEVRKGLAIFIFIAVLWLTEAIPLTITALFVPVLASFLGVLGVTDALSSFANPVIFLFFGGFALASALHKHEIDVAIARHIIYLAKGNFYWCCIFLFLVTAFLSMWISNTATTAMLLPIALGMLTNLDAEKNHKAYVFVLLGIAYSANIGGIATIVGSPPNIIAANALNLSFIDWLKVGLPTALILLPLLIFLLTMILKPHRASYQFKVEKSTFHLTRPRIITLSIFIFAVLGWLLSAPLSKFFGIDTGFDSLIAISIILLLGISGVVKWPDIEKHTSWGVLLLFGGGLTLSAILATTGADQFLADLLNTSLSGTYLWIIVLSIVTFVIFLTELASNTATAALLIPLFMIIAESLGIPSQSLVIAVAVCASCAFMLPVATPPNALVFGTGYIQQREMMKIGFLFNIISSLIISALVYFIY